MTRDPNRRTPELSHHRANQGHNRIVSTLYASDEIDILKDSFEAEDIKLLKDIVNNHDKDTKVSHIPVLYHGTKTVDKYSDSK